MGSATILESEKLSLLRDAAKLWSFLHDFDSCHFQMLPQDLVAQLAEFRWLVLPRRDSCISYPMQLDASAEHTLRYIQRDDSCIAGTTYRYRDMRTAIRQLEVCCNTTFDSAAATTAANSPELNVIKLEPVEYGMTSTVAVEVIPGGSLLPYHNSADHEKQVTAMSTARPRDLPDNVDGQSTTDCDEYEDVANLLADIPVPAIQQPNVAMCQLTTTGNATTRYRKKGSYVCTECGTGRSYANKSSLERHLRQHTGEKPFTCDTCGKRFSCRGNRDKHTRLRHAKSRNDVMTHPCPYCGKHFTDIYIGTHIRLHLLSPGNGGLKAHGAVVFAMDDDGARSDEIATPAVPKNPFRCKVCGREFIFRSALAEHERSHDDARPFVCETCGKAFKRTGDLTVHVRMSHVTRVRFPCSICGAVLASKMGLIRHTRTHTNERPYLCMECGRSFSGYSNHRKHLKVHAKRKAADSAGGSSAVGTGLKVITAASSDTALNPSHPRNVVIDPMDNGTDVVWPERVNDKIYADFGTKL